MVFPILVDTYVPAFLHVLAWRGDVRYKRVLPTIIHTKYLGGFRVAILTEMWSLFFIK